MVESLIDMSIDFAGIELRNPVISASGPHGWSGEGLKRAAQKGGVGAVITKTLSWEPTPHPRVGRYHLIEIEGRPVWIHTSEQWTTLPIDKWIREEFKIGAEGGVPIIASIGGYYPDVEKVARLASTTAGVNEVKGLELNPSCPNIRAGDIKGEKVQVSPFANPRAIEELTKVVKKEVNIPLGVKLPCTFNIVDCAKAAVAGGADWVTAVQGIRGISRIDLNTGMPANRALGGVIGPAFKPIALRLVAEVAMNVKIPVSGVGGISVWKDAIEHIMVGATTVQICSAAIWRGHKVFSEVIEGIGKYVQEKGYISYEEFLHDYKGISLKFVGVPIPELAKEQRCVPLVDETKCNGCALCESSCMYFAIKMIENIAKADPDKCDGCGMCEEVCPLGAIKLVKLATVVH